MFCTQCFLEFGPKVKQIHKKQWHLISEREWSEGGSVEREAPVTRVWATPETLQTTSWECFWSRWNNTTDTIILFWYGSVGNNFSGFVDKTIWDFREGRKTWGRKRRWRQRGDGDMALAQTQSLLRTGVKAQVCVFLFVYVCAHVNVWVLGAGLNIRAY